MPGLQQITNVSMTNITDITNITSPAEFFINVNNIIYDGVLFFILLCVLWMILGKAHYDYGKSRGEDDILVSALESGAVITVLSLLLRAIEVTNEGVITGLLTDAQMWIFPLLTVVLALIVYSTKE